jgi:hypothetical protein
MKYAKILGLLAVAAAALMAFVGSASATITAPAGTAYTGNLHLTGTGIAFTTGGSVACNHSTLIGSVTNGGTKVPITSLSFNECGSSTVSVPKLGYMSIASDGTVTVSETEYTKLTHNIFIGTKHCILKFENTVFGILTEGVNPAPLHTDTYTVPHVETDASCSEAVLHGDYTAIEPTGAITID